MPFFQMELRGKEYRKAFIAPRIAKNYKMMSNRKLRKTEKNQEGNAGA